MNYVLRVKKKSEEDELTHHGTKGMKWGRRRFQNEDGSLTDAGKKRYGVGDGDGDSKNKPKDIVVNNPKEGVDYVDKSGSGKSGGIMSLVPHRQPVEDPQVRAERRAELDKEFLEAYRKGEIEVVDMTYNQVDPSRSKIDANGNLIKKGSNESEKTESFKPGDDGYEIHNAPKNDSGSDSASKSKPKDIHDVDFEDKTADKQSSGKSKTEKELEEAHKRGEERRKEAEKNKREEEAEKKKNEAEREKAKRENEAEERKKEVEAKKREQEAEKNRREEEAAESKTDRLKRLKLENELHKTEKEHDKNFDPDTIKRQKEIDDLDAAKNVLDGSRNISNEFANIAGRSKVNVPRMNLDHLTNDQLQKAIQRDLLESQYDRAFNTKRAKAEARKERTQTFFQNLGSGLAIAGSALYIAKTIKGLKGK